MEGSVSNTLMHDTLRRVTKSPFTRQRRKRNKGSLFSAMEEQEQRVLLETWTEENPLNNFSFE
jgi:hypothetical protein